MRLRQTTLPWLVLLVVPIVVALARLPVAAAVALVVLVLAWRWLLSLRGLVRRPTGPDLVLETIAASHFAEKVRWAMDRLGVDYREEAEAFPPRHRLRRAALPAGPEGVRRPTR